MKVIVSRLMVVDDDKVKKYKVVEGVFYIDDEAIEIAEDTIVDYDVADDEDIDYIRRNTTTNEVSLGVVFFVSLSTSEEVFTHDENVVTTVVSPTKGFTLTESEDNGIICEAQIEDLEGMEW